MKKQKSQFVIPVSADHPATNHIRHEHPELYDRLDCGNPECPDPECKGMLICETETNFFHAPQHGPVRLERVDWLVCLVAFVGLLFLPELIQFFEGGVSW